MEMRLADQLRRSAVLTFEELAFVFVELEPDDAQVAAPFEAGARVAFDGPLCGWLSIRLYGGLLATLTRNMLPELDESSRAMGADTLKEIANVICGNLLPAAAGAEAVFDLHPPESDDVEIPPPGSPEPAAVVVIGLEDGRAELSLYLEGDASKTEGEVR
jgi:hypothetical protein